MTKTKRYQIVVFCVGMLVLTLLWFFVALPQLLKMSDNFYYKADIFSTDNFYNETEKHFTGEVLSKTIFSYDVVGKEQRGLLVKNVFDVRKPSGEKIFTVERLYGIDPKTGKHLNGVGDRSRWGYLFGPKLADKGDFVYWHINYDTPALMSFKSEEKIKGLNAYRYECKYSADQTNNLIFLPGVPGKRGVELDISLTLWIEPITGLLIKYEDYTTAWYYDRLSHKRICPWNKFHNTYNDISITENVKKCSAEKSRVLMLKYGGPGIVLIISLVAIFIWSFPVKQRFWKVYVPTAVTLIITSGICIAVYISLNNQQKANKELEFASGSRDIQANIIQEAEQSLNVLFNLKGLQEGENRLDRNQFKQIAQHYLQNTKSIQAVSWLPRVTLMQRSVFERTFKKEGYAQNGFTEIDSKGNRKRAGNRPEYCPITFIEPENKNASAIGFDLLSEPRRRAALNYAKKTGEIAITDGIRLVQFSEVLSHIIVIPVFDSRSNNRELMGYYTGILRLNELVLNGLNYPGYNRNIKVELYFGENRPENLVFSNLKPSDRVHHVLYNKLQIANRTCTIKFISANEFYNDTDAKTNMLVLIVSLVFASSISFFVFWILSSNRSELESINRNLRIVSNQLKGIINGTTDEILAVDRHYRIIAFNDAMAESMSKTWDINIKVGDSIHQMFGLELMDLRKPFEKRYWERALSGDYFSVEELEQLTDRTKTLEVIYYPIRDDDGTVIGCSQIARDITDRKAAEAELKNRTEQMEEAQRIARIGSWQWDMMTNKIKWSDELYKILDVDKELVESSYFNFIDAVHPDDRELIRSIFKKSQVDATPFEFHCRTIFKNGQIHVLHCLGEVLLDEENRPCQMSGTAQDVTEIKAIEEELKKAKEQAEQSAVAKDRFLANMSHEIRTPMNALLGFSDILDKTNLDQQQREYLSAIKTSGVNLLALINDILVYSKIEAGMMSIEETKFDLPELFHSLNILLQQNAKEKKLDLRFIIDPEIPKWVVGDSLRLTQILLNLVGNSLKFTEKGTVKMAASLTRMTSETVDVTIEVSDTGIGIPSEKLGSIFERFNQASTETSRKYGGTGLGLSIVKALLEIQGSTIEVESTQGEGSRFWFTIAYKRILEQEQDVAELRPAIHEDELALGKLNVLLAEDNKMNQKLASIIIGGFGFELDIAENGAQAVEMFRDKKYDVILMDMQMPEMDGYEATKIIRNEYKSTIPIIAMTANALEGEREKCLGLGMNEYVSKPFNRSQLLFAIQHVLVEQ